MLHGLLVRPDRADTQLAKRLQPGSVGARISIGTQNLNKATKKQASSNLPLTMTITTRRADALCIALLLQDCCAHVQRTVQKSFLMRDFLSRQHSLLRWHHMGLASL